MQNNMLNQRFSRLYYITLSWWAIKFISKYFFELCAFAVKKEKEKKKKKTTTTNF